MPRSLLEREEISLAVTEDRDTPWATIARRVHRRPATVMREVVRNAVLGATVLGSPRADRRASVVGHAHVAWSSPGSCESE